MKKCFLAALIMLMATATTSAQSSKYRIIKCVSGNCQTGFGEAVLKYGDFTASYYYKGNFKNGWREGEGQTYNEDRQTLYIGIYKNNLPYGYGIEWNVKPGKDVYGIPDSTKYIMFRKHKTDDEYLQIAIKQGNPVEVAESVHHEKYPTYEQKKVTDSKLNEMVNNYLLATGNKGVEESKAAEEARAKADQKAFDEAIVAAKNIRLEHGEWQEIYFNTLLNKRSYYPSFDLKGDKDFKVLPPNVTIYYRIYDDKGNLLKDFNDNYWGERVPFKPAADGNYKVMIRYLQDAKATANQYLRPQMKLFWRLRYFDK